MTPSSSGEAASGPAVCIVLHDAAPSTRSACVRTLAAVRQVAGDAPVTILAVPRYHDEAPSAEFEAWLGERMRRGDELALHGCTHRDDGVPQGRLDALRRSHYTRGEGEFWALSRREALARIDVGIEWFAKNGWPLAGFVAPAWLLGPGAREALVERPFEYTATLRQLDSTAGAAGRDQPERRLQHVERVAAEHLARLERPGRSRRTEQPGAAHRAASARCRLRRDRRSWQRILERALKRRRPTTVAEFMRHARSAENTVWMTTTRRY